ncbi:zf-TFIIB domain-containing protein [Leucobacter chromiireducens]|uniref:TFIIB-type zinc ribbon-containing protein n=1 Tax=Leucobacter chromiireducens TaxID=283877 RepID=UPI000F6346F8|nr:zf-TFIIB domain-containing protein [Leucobacter chromiireducens]
MNCPSDGTTLLMSERQGIEIDYCPECRGIWLDRGELDKILERAQAEAAAFTAPQATTPQAPAQPTQPAPPAPQQYAAPQHYADPVPTQPAADPRHGQYGGGDYRQDDRRRDSRGGDPRYGDPRYRKKKSPFDFLGDIFD